MRYLKVDMGSAKGMEGEMCKVSAGITVKRQGDDSCAGICW